MSTLVKDHDVVLFQGDSITDCGRNRDIAGDLGHGYPMMAASWFSALYPERRVTFINRGVSGDRVQNLKSRWQEDCIALKPDWVSILIGINDTWRRYDSNDATSAEDYAKDYRFILSSIKESLPDTKIIICEPFVLPSPADRKQWRADLDPKIQEAREIAREYNTIYIPLDGIFAKASTSAEPEYWAADGVHPTLPGHALIAQNWLRAIDA